MSKAREKFCEIVSADSKKGYPGYIVRWKFDRSSHSSKRIATIPRFPVPEMKFRDVLATFAKKK